MQEPRVPSQPADAVRLAPEAGGRASLESLLVEVTALANQLRKTTALKPRHDNSPQGGWSILQTLGRLGPQTVPDIARTRALSRQNIQVLVNRLESQGYVAVTPNPAHKRSGLVELTEHGRRSLAAVMEYERLSPWKPCSRTSPARAWFRRPDCSVSSGSCLRGRNCRRRY